MRGCEGAALRVFPATKDCMAAPCHDAYLMREVIRGHQRSSEVIRGHQERSAMPRCVPCRRIECVLISATSIKVSLELRKSVGARDALRDPKQVLAPLDDAVKGVDGGGRLAQRREQQRHGVLHQVGAIESSQEAAVDAEAFGLRRDATRCAHDGARQHGLDDTPSQALRGNHGHSEAITDTQRQSRAPRKAPAERRPRASLCKRSPAAHPTAFPALRSPHGCSASAR